MADSTLLAPADPGHSRSGRGRSSSTVDDEDAFALLVAFTRLARNSRHNEEIPGRLRSLINEGVLAPRHVTAFAIVAMHGPLSISEVAQKVGCATTTASLVATQLADAGLIERSEDTLDRRRTVVTVAPAYRKESQVVLASRLAPLRRAMERMGPQRTRDLMEGLAYLGRGDQVTRPIAMRRVGAGLPRS